jgi:hypothetical protein
MNMPKTIARKPNSLRGVTPIQEITRSGSDGMPNGEDIVADRDIVRTLVWQRGGFQRRVDPQLDVRA